MPELTQEVMAFQEPDTTPTSEPGRSLAATKEERLAVYSDQCYQSRDKALDAFLQLGTALHYAREEFPSNNLFGEWLKTEVPWLGAREAYRLRIAAERYVISVRQNLPNGLLDSKLSWGAITEIVESNAPEEIKTAIDEIVIGDGIKLTAAQIRELMAKAQEQEDALKQRSVDEVLTDAQIAEIRANAIRDLREQMNQEHTERIEALKAEKEKEKNQAIFDSHANLIKEIGDLQAKIDEFDNQDDLQGRIDELILELNKKTETIETMEVSELNEVQRLKGELLDAETGLKERNDLLIEVNKLKARLKEARTPIIIDGEHKSPDQIRDCFVGIWGSFEPLLVCIKRLALLMSGDEESQEIVIDYARPEFNAMITHLCQALDELPPIVKEALSTAKLDSGTIIDVTPGR